MFALYVRAPFSQALARNALAAGTMTICVALCVAADRYLGPDFVLGSPRRKAADDAPSVK